jgi:hypothetical protein
MSNFTFRYPASAIAGKHRLTADDIILLRKHMFPEGPVSDDDVRQLLALHRSPAEKCAQWDNWFVEMIAAFIVVHTHPRYSLDEHNAEWLIALVSRDGVVETEAELELVLHAMEMSAFVPETLSAFALAQLHIALERKTGAFAEARRAKRSGIGAGDIEFIHRILRGAVTGGKLLLGRQQIAVLDRIDTVVRSHVNHPAWRALIGSISQRTPASNATAASWLQMLAEDTALDEAA